MKKLTVLSLAMSLAFLSGCGGGSSDSTSSSNSSSSNSSSTGTAESQCNRGILLNSKITGTTIFDEPLYLMDYARITLDKGVAENQLFADEIQRNGQMLYVNYKPIYNVSAEELDQDTIENEEIYNSYILNSKGLYTQKTLQKQKDGWPFFYLASSQGLQVSTALFNDECSLNAVKQNYDYEKIDLSGKKIADIFPNNILNEFPKVQEYTYLHNQIGGILQENPKALTTLLSSTATFPAGSYVYIPKSVVNDDYQFYFSESTVSSETTLQDWVNNTYSQFKDKFTIGKVYNLNVAYTVDTKGNPAFEAGTDPAIEKDGKIYDGEWDFKGDVLTLKYDLYLNGELVNYESKGSYALFNKSSFEFIAQQIKNNYQTIN